MKYLRILLFLAFLAGAKTGISQTSRLAMQYFETGEFEKAASLFKELYEKDPRSTFYFDKYIESLLAMEDFDESEKVVKARLKKEPQNLALYVTQGKILEAQFKDDEAEKLYEEAIKKMPTDRLEVVKLGNEFVNMNKFDLAIKTYERGSKLLKDDIIFSYNLGDLYRRKHDTEKMIHYFLNAMENETSRIDNVKLLLERYLSGDDWKELQEQLYERLQTNQENILYSELLSWVFIQNKDYKNAFRQVKALDRRLRENGARVYDLANMAVNAKEYDVAISAFDYLVSSKDPSSSIYLDAKRELLYTKRRKITEAFEHNREDFLALVNEYEEFLNEFGRNKNTANMILDLASIYAFYLDSLETAISLLEEMVALPGLNQYLKATGKIQLADYYLMHGDRWESTLLYSQVDKEFKEDLIGQTARFKNAKLSYYVGDFQWAQTQFDVLKASTSKLIANDALDLSVFIMDNMGLDTTAKPLELYAQSELLVFQNKYDEAEKLWNEIESDFPDHSLTDDILYLKAQMYTRMHEYSKAAEMYQKILDDHLEEIRADNALFALAQLYETNLKDIEKAKTLYERLFIDFSGSTLAVEARKRYRILRGDFEEPKPDPEQ
ncbi:MAG: tetratricopeptide repeat protein [Saprospiraceae bacterium]|nr:tetratricopeptide repeat protein [Saprospiraceae bacterium]